MSEPKTFDLEKVYDKAIFPLMAQIIAICKDHHLPMLATFLYKSDPEGCEDGEDGYCTTSLTWDDHAMSEEMNQAHTTLVARRPRGFKITTRDADGKITAQEIVLRAQ